MIATFNLVMNSTIQSFICPHLLALKAYSSARSEFKGKADVFLDANENTIQTQYNRYPDPLQGVLKNKIASLAGRQASELFLGNGSDEAIDLLLRLFCVSGQDAIITMPPTYGMYAVSAQIANVQNIQIPLDENFQPQVDKVLAAQTTNTKLLFICSPNNPTGNNIQVEYIEALIEGFDGIVVIDEAYIHFSEQASCLQYLDRYEHVVILQTFSKAWGLAGLRLGMAWGSASLIEWINKIKAPYNINTCTQETALQVLEQPKRLTKDVQTILQERTQLKTTLANFPIVQKVHPSAANFLLFEVTNADELYQYLTEKGIVIRNRSRVYGCANCLRVTIGTSSEQARLLEALEVYATQVV